MTTTVVQAPRRIGKSNKSDTNLGSSVSANVSRLRGVSGRVRYGALADDELVSLTRAGERDAFGELVRRYQGRVGHLALKITKNENDAQEVVQEVFLNAYAKLDSFKGTAAFSSWLYRVASNGALMLLRSRKKDLVELWEGGALRTDMAISVPADWSVQSDQVMERKQIAGVLEQEFATLPMRYKKILVLRELDGLSNRDIADALNLSIAAVKSRLHRARLILRKRLAHHKQIPALMEC